MYSQTAETETETETSVAHNDGFNCPSKERSHPEVNNVDYLITGK